MPKPIGSGLNDITFDFPLLMKIASKAVRDWMKAVGAKTAPIEPISPWENGYCESFN